MKDMKEKKCGCVIFEVGPPILCDEHQAKQAKKDARAQVLEEKGLRRIVVDRSRELGHDPTTFKPYGSQPGKWTAYCRHCGALIIVYDSVPERGDQVAGGAAFKTCRRGGLVEALAGTDEVQTAESSDVQVHTDAAD